ncbi:MAG: hypothetical protein IKI40_08480 [Treponema sp.]|nr:hypothetical protein [Treponema sp.]
MAKGHSLASKFSIGAVLIILMVLSICSATTGFFFSRNCRESFYASALGSIAEFSESISMFFNAKETELNVFADSDEIKAADETIHSFVNESGEIKILIMPKALQKKISERYARVSLQMTVTLRKSTSEQNGADMTPEKEAGTRLRRAANESGKALSEISSLMENSIGEIGKQVDQFTV